MYLAQSQKIGWQLVTKASEDESEEISVGEQWWWIGMGATTGRWGWLPMAGGHLIGVNIGFVTLGILVISHVDNRRKRKIINKR